MIARLGTRVFERLHAHKKAPFAHVPGPPPLFPVGNLHLFAGCAARPWELFQELTDRYGDYVLIWVNGDPALVVHDPEALDSIFVTDAQNFYKTEPCEALRPVVTNSNPFILNGEAWRRKRALNPMSGDLSAWFTQQTPRLMQALTHQVRAKAHQGQTFPLHTEGQRWVFDGFSLLTAGRLFSEQNYADLMHVIRVGDMRMKTRAPVLGSGFDRARRRWVELFRLTMDEARRLPKEPSHALLRQFVHGTRLSSDDFCNEMANVFPGGLFSTTSALINALALLARHPHVLSQLQREVRALEQPKLKAIEACALLEGVLRETMRLYPPAPITMRTVKVGADVRFGTHDIPDETDLIITTAPLHRHAGHWSKPHTFLPERWQGDTLAQNTFGSRYFFPFGRGERTCMGQSFALFFLRVALFTILREVDIEVDGNGPPPQTYFFGCAMPTDLNARLIPAPKQR